MHGKGITRFAWSAVAAAALAAPYAHGAADLPSTRAVALTALVRNDCGACHGMRLEGGLGPALTPARLAGRSPEAVALVITHGRAAQAMPAWRPLLSSHDIDWIAHGLLDGRFLVPEAR